MINYLKTVRHNKLFVPTHFWRDTLDNFRLLGKTPTPDVSLDRTFQWIKASFDATGDGGSSAYYRFSTGWKGSYPETTGYLIPTIYEYARLRNDESWRKIGRRAADWLLSIQAPEGGWQGLQIGEKCDLRVFNSAMILDGLIAAYLVENDKKYLDSAHRGLDWIMTRLDQDHFFSENNVVGGGAFDTLVCACLLMVVQHLPEDQQASYRERITNSLDAHLKLQTETGWFHNCNFKKNNTALLHHLGYTMDGLVISAEILGEERFYQAALKTAKKLLSKFEVNTELPAFSKPDWSPHFDLVKHATWCLTGMSQTAIVFQKIAAKENDLRFLNAALKLNDFVASVGNYRSGNAGISYGLPGSFPVGGGYQTYQFVNWAAKYHAESILLSMNAQIPKKKP